MEIQQLIGFVQVARQGSFTRAAEATGRTQSAVSQQVRALEKELGCPLIQRGGRMGLRLNHAGRKVLGFAQEVLAGQEALTREIDQLRGLAMGRLTIAAPFTTLYQLMPEIIAGYQQRHPLVELSVLDRPQPEVVGLVRDGRADLGLVLASAAPRSLAVEVWKKIEPYLLAPHGHPLCRLEAPSLADIAPWPLILPPQDLMHPGERSLRQGFEEMGLDYSVVMESSNVELTSRFVGAGLGIGFASMIAQGPRGIQEGLAFIPLAHLLDSDHLALIHRRAKSAPDFVQAFRELLLAA